MNVLQPEPALSISTNECKKQFLVNEINEMKMTKDIYINILDQLKSILKQSSSLINNDQKVSQTSKTQYIQSQNPDKQQTLARNIKQQEKIGNEQIITTPQQKANIIQEKQMVNNHINKFTCKLQEKIRDYCCSQISQNIVKYLQIEKQQRYFYPHIMTELNCYIKDHEKLISHREKQLQQVQDLKYSKSQKTHDKENNSSPFKNFQQKDKQATEKTISSFDFNRRVLELAKKEITFLKLKKRKLQIQIEEKKKYKQSFQAPKSQTFSQVKKIEHLHESTAAGISQELNLKKLPSLKQNSPLKNNFQVVQPKNQMSSFEKIVMVFQKQKFVNTLMEEKIQKLQRKIVSQKRQNQLIKAKAENFQRQIQKLDWNKVCDESFVAVQNKKLDKALELSILDRTELRQFNQLSVEYSKMDINQSVIRKF